MQFKISDQDSLIPKPFSLQASAIQKGPISIKLNIVESNIQIDKFILFLLIMEPRCRFDICIWDCPKIVMRGFIARFRMWLRLLWRFVIVFQLFAKTSCYHTFVIGVSLLIENWKIEIGRIHTNCIDKIPIWATIKWLTILNRECQ